jgi:hypothetical protein
MRNACNFFPRQPAHELQRNLDLPQSAIARKHPELVGTFHTAAIKSFEHAYELSVRLLRRSLTLMAATISSRWNSAP